MRRAALSVALLATACGILQGPAPEWVVNRQPLPACGTEVLEQGQAGEPELRRCLLEAFEEGRGAELITTRPTIEGDPVTEYLRVHENGVVEMFIDATRDQFGSGEWERMVCDGLTPVEDLEDAPDAGAAPEMVFVQHGCEPLPVP
jgi:hypothetical protein